MLSQLDTWLADFMAWSAWAMEKPKAYGPFHLTWFILGIAVCILLGWKLRKLGDKGNRILLVGVGIFLIVCEVYKQLFYYYYIGERSYQWWIFPFQLCSVPMYLCVIAPLLKPGKVQQGMYHFMMTFNLLGGFMGLVEPSGLSHEYWTLTLHAFIWHTMLIFIGVYLGLSDRTQCTKKDFKLAVYTFVSLAAVAFCINLIFRDISGGSINMFFVGPSNSSLLVFSTISKMFGWYISTILYILAVCLGAFVIFLPFYYWKKKKAN